MRQRSPCIGRKVTSKRESLTSPLTTLPPRTQSTGARRPAASSPPPPSRRRRRRHAHRSSAGAARTGSAGLSPRDPTSLLLLLLLLQSSTYNNQTSKQGRRQQEPHRAGRIHRGVFLSLAHPSTPRILFLLPFLPFPWGSGGFRKPVVRSRAPPSSFLQVLRSSCFIPTPLSSDQFGIFFLGGLSDCASVCCLRAFGTWSAGLEEFCLRNSSARFPWIMGAFCSCLQPDYSDHHGNHTSSAFRNCACLRCFTQHLINAYTVLFRAGAVHSVSQSIEATPVDSSESSFDTYRSPPRPLPYDDPRFSPPARNWLRHETPSHSPEESEPLRANDDDEEMVTPSRIDKASKTNYDTKMKICSSAYGDKVPPKELGSYFSYFSPTAEDEDVCPTCLEDYTSENPRIVMQCSHHFHLGCIYEWMERSEACPVCGKKMEFDETT